MEQEKLTVTIELNQYNELLKQSYKYHTLLKAIYRRPDLNYRGNALRFDEDDVNLALELVDGIRYDIRIQELQKMGEDTES